MREKLHTKTPESSLCRFPWERFIPKKAAAKQTLELSGNNTTPKDEHSFQLGKRHDVKLPLTKLGLSNEKTRHTFPRYHTREIRFLPPPEARFLEKSATLCLQFGNHQQQTETHFASVFHEKYRPPQNPRPFSSFAENLPSLRQQSCIPCECPATRAHPRLWPSASENFWRLFGEPQNLELRHRQRSGEQRGGTPIAEETVSFVRGETEEPQTKKIGRCSGAPSALLLLSLFPVGVLFTVVPLAR